MVLKWGFLHVVSKTEQMQERDDNINWVPNDADYLVAEENWSFRHDPRCMSLNNPNSVINNVLTFQAL
jgi:hypothetical protein